VSLSSGVFIGTNNAIGWSAHSKHNYGFGSVSDGSVTGGKFTIMDNDMVDAPIEDNDTIVYTEPSPGSDLAMRLNNINVNGLDSNASLSVGNNRQPGWSSHGKLNLSRAFTYGKTLQMNDLSIIYDNDLVDVPIENKVKIDSKVDSGGGD
jgi:hypothetical protein